MEITIGKHSYTDRIIKTGKRGTVTIGKYCSIGSNVHFVTMGHNVHWVSTFPFGEFSSPRVEGHPRYADIEIQNDVWIGTGVTIVAPARICNGAVIGTGSVVRGLVYPYEVYIGNPAFSIKNRFTEEQTLELLRIAWWEWPDEKIFLYRPLMCNDKVDEFIDAVKNNKRGLLQ